MMDPTWAFLSLLLLLLLITSSLALNPNRKRARLPPSPRPAIPLIGHLHFLKFPIHRTCQTLSRQLNTPIFTLRLGIRRMVVVSSRELLDECFVKNDVVLANRPRLLIGKYIGYNFTTLVGASYGDHWRNLRRLTVTEIFSPARLAVFQWMREDETRILVDKIRSRFGKIALRPLLSDLVFNNIMRMVSGKRYFGNREEDGDEEEARQFQELIKEAFARGGVGNPGDFLPFLQYVDFRGYEKSLQKLGDKMDSFLQFLIDEKKNKKKGFTITNTTIDHLLSLQESEPDYYTDTIIKGIMLVMLLAGTDTSSVTIEWAMSALLNHPEKMELARRELDQVVGLERMITESDIPKLPYLHNIVLETMRLYPAAPMLVPHEASSDCKIGGYDVPQGTIVMGNAWAIHRDPMLWDEPLQFRPERFEISGEDAKLVPFGIGRRSCPGNGLANRVVSSVLGSLIQCFEWRRLGDELVDMSEGIGTSMPKIIPLEAMCKPRACLKFQHHE